MRIRLTRRQLVLSLAAITGGGAGGYWLLGSDDTAPIDLALPPVGNPLSPTFEVFLALSQIVLARPRLEEELARRMYQVFMEEPWGPKHIGNAYAQLRQEIVQHSRRSPHHGAPVSVLQAGERWFISHLVTTWYTGIYFHEQRPTRRIAHEGALMYEATRGAVPIPYVENVGYGGWTKPAAPVGDGEAR